MMKNNFPNGKKSVKRKMQTPSGSQISMANSQLDNTVDDFQEGHLIFRAPKRVKTEVHLRQKSQSSSIRSGTSRSNQSNQTLINKETLNIASNNDIAFLEIEKSVCSSSEKLCPSCKNVVMAQEFSSHISSCFERFSFDKKPITTSSEVVGMCEKNKFGSEILPCPICLKPQTTDILRITHTKKCGLAHGLFTEKTLLAVRVQERQFEERLSLGLPLVQFKGKENVSQPKKRVSSKTDTNLDMDLALALSRSLVEMEKEKRLQEEDHLVQLGVPGIIIGDRRMKPPLPIEPVRSMQVKISSRPKKGGRKILRKQTALTTRTQEERERIISEKVALILSSEEVAREASAPVTVKGVLKKFVNQPTTLWNMSSKSECQLADFYVEDLNKYIQPQDVEIGGLLKHFSQVPGRLNFSRICQADDLQSELSDDEDDITGEDERTIVDGYSTQLMLAELLGSQEFPDNSFFEPIEEPSSGSTDCNLKINVSSNSIPDGSSESNCTTSYTNSNILNESSNVISEDNLVDILSPNLPDSHDTEVILLEENEGQSSISFTSKHEKTDDSEININTEPTGAAAIDDNKIDYPVNNEATSGNCSSEDDANVMAIEPESSAVKLEEESEPFSSTSEEMSTNCVSSGSSLQDPQVNPLPCTLIYDWSRILASGQGSDLKICTQDGDIPVHSLVFLARCPLLFEVSQLNKILKWTSVAYDAAFMFMVYVYTGQCSIDCINGQWIGLLDLALTYNCQELVKYLEDIYKNGSPVKSPSGEPLKKSDECNFSDGLLESANDDNTEVSFLESKIESCDSANVMERTADPEEQVEMVNNTLAASPDIFQDIDENSVSYFRSPNNKSELILNCSGNSNLCNISETRRKLSYESDQRLFSASATQSAEKSPIEPGLLHLRLSDSSQSTCAGVVVLTLSSDDSECGNMSPCKSPDQLDEIHNKSEKTQENNILFNDITIGDTLNNDSTNEASPIVISNISSAQNNDFYVSGVWDDFEECGLNDMQELDPVIPANKTKNDVKMHGECHNMDVSSAEVCLVTATVGAKDGFPGASTVSNYKGVSPNMHTMSPLIEQRKTGNLYAVPQVTYASIGDDTLLQVAMDCESDHVSSVQAIRNKSSKLTSHKFSSPSTPINPLRNRNLGGITPMAGYKTMLTPELKKALEKYGLRNMSRNKAIKLLVHIYDEMHPLVTDSEANSSYCETPTTIQTNKKDSSRIAVNNGCARVRKANLQCKSSCNVQSENLGLNSSQTSNTSLEESENESLEATLFGSDGGTEEDEMTLTQQGNLDSQLLNFIKSRSELHQKILLYQPVWCSEFQDSLKKAGIKCSKEKLLKFLDEQCITFRFDKVGEKTTRRRQRRRKNSRSPRKNKKNIQSVNISPVK